jgi:hypothetical protein
MAASDNTSAVTNGSSSSSKQQVGAALPPSITSSTPTIMAPPMFRSQVVVTFHSFTHSNPQPHMYVCMYDGGIVHNFKG